MYTVQTISEGGVTLDCLTCKRTGAEIRVAPDAGLNWTHWIVNGTDRLWKSDAFFTRNENGGLGAGGSPLLFPMVGRTWDMTVNPPVFGQYRQTPGGTAFRMPIHGFGALMRWERVAAGESDGRGILRYRADITPEIRATMYPYEIEFGVTYGLDGTDAFVRFDAIGTGTAPAPFAFGTHPYLRLNTRAGQTLSVPSKDDRELAAGLSIPAQPGVAVEKDDFGDGRAIDLSGAWDRVFVNLYAGDVRLEDASGAGYELAFDHELFNTCVVYTDATNPCLCIEPWTDGLGGFSYAADPAKCAACGMPAVQPGEMISGEVRLSVLKA